MFSGEESKSGKNGKLTNVHNVCHQTLIDIFLPVLNIQYFAFEIKNC